MFKKTFSFKGRIRRLEYGLSILISFCILFGMLAAIGTSSESMPDNISALLFLATLIILILLIWLHMAQSAKRCHDLNKSGWFQFIPFYQLWLLFAEGNINANRFGNNPIKNNQISHPDLLDSHLNYTFKDEVINKRQPQKKQRKLFKNVFSFKGRIRRLEYGLTFIMILIPYSLLSYEMEILNENPEEEIGAYVIVLFLTMIPIVWLSIAQRTKRCHDRDLSGWYQLIPFFDLVLLFGKGTEGENQYGKDPKGQPDNNNSQLIDDEIIRYDD